MKRSIIFLVVMSLLGCEKNEVSPEDNKASETKKAELNITEFIGTEGFHRTKWGMTPSDVKNIYTETETRNLARGSALHQKAIISDLKAEISFIFTKGHLASVDIDFDYGPTNDLKVIKQLLVERYGQPKEVNVNNQQSSWDTDETFVKVYTLLDDTGKAHLKMLVFKSKKHADKAKTVTPEDLQVNRR